MQPRLWFLVLAGVWLSATWGLAEDRAARDILDRGIAALGGKKVLTSQRALSGNSRGTLQFNDMRSAVSNDWIVQGIDHFKWSSKVTINNSDANIVIVLAGDKAWISGNNQPGNALEKPAVTALRHGFAGLRLAESLTPLLDKEYTLSALGEIKIDDKPALGIKAKRKDLPELDIYFDKATSLPIKAEMRIKETDSQEATYVARFGEYKKFAGRQHFTKFTVYRDDKVVLEMERGDIEAKEKVPDETFAKP